jgi:hypothetical protein
MESEGKRIEWRSRVGDFNKVDDGDGEAKYVREIYKV